MKYFISAFILAILILPVSSVYAATDYASLPFKISSISFAPLEQDKATTQFEVKLAKNSNGNTISYWKVRMYCEEGVKLNISNTTENECGKAVTITDQDMSSFLLFFKTNTGKVSDFSFAVKAYDANGDWLQTERQNFSWK